MVGNEEGKRHQCNLDPRLCCIEERWGVGTTGISIFKCRRAALESEPRADDADAKDQDAAEARAASGLHDQGAGSQVSMARKADAASGAVLPDWLVHGLAEISDNGPEVVDDQS